MEYKIIEVLKNPTIYQNLNFIIQKKNKKSTSKEPLVLLIHFRMYSSHYKTLQLKKQIFTIYDIHLYNIILSFLNKYVICLM
jgi:hypothetical protein